MTRPAPRLRITTHAVGPGGRGFEEVLHRAYLGDELIGEWSRRMLAPWAGDVRGAIVLGRYRSWRGAIDAIVEDRAPA